LEGFFFAGGRTMAHQSLLGPLEVTLDGETVTSFEPSKVRALPAYLATEADRPHRRDSLALLFWSDCPDRAARSNLPQTLANLRKVIDDRHATPPFPRIARETIQFNMASDCWLDVKVCRVLKQALARLTQGLAASKAIGMLLQRTDQPGMVAEVYAKAGGSRRD
jgi:DNA-binding SARP family transcriptional activator